MKSPLLRAALFVLLLSPFTLASPPRNILLFVCDDLSRDLGCYGHKVVKTPNIDRLAAEGTRFDYAFCTTASCSASRSVILTGLHNHANGQYGHQHGQANFHTFESVKSLPVRLAAGGYRTIRIGKFHVQPEDVYKFDHCLKSGQGGDRNVTTMAEQCRPLLAAKDSRPFFLYFCTSDPHRGGGGRKDRPHNPDAFGNNMKYDGITEVTYDPKDMVVPPFLPDTPACREELAQYCQSVSRIDQGLGKLIALLKETGHYDNTLILFTSDNGIAFPGAKTTLYEPGMRLPLIARSPDQKQRGLASDAMVSWVDFAPTLLDFAAVKSEPRAFHGRSFLPAIDGAPLPGPDEVYSSHTFHEITMYYPVRLIRTRQYKLILNIAHPLPFPFASDLYRSATWQSVLQSNDSIFGQRKIDAFIHRPKYELYDLKSDPDEVKNLIDDPKHAQIASELKEKLKDYQKKTKDPWFSKYIYE